MTRGAWLAAIAGGALLVVAVGVTLVAVAADDGSTPAHPSGSVAAALEDPSPAAAPFEDLTETTIRVGGEPLDVVVADDDAERYQGLRARDDIGPYDGMLFVFDAPTTTAFTMSTVPVPLQIGFYDADGHVVDRLLMQPCADAQDRCPRYRASGAFTYALETLESDLPRGALSA